MLYGLWHLQLDCHSCYESGYFSSGSEALLSAAIKEVCREIRPQAVNLVECFKVHDTYLQSAVGNSYGDIYETHLEWAKDSKLNK